MANVKTCNVSQKLAFPNGNVHRDKVQKRKENVGYGSSTKRGALEDKDESEVNN